MRFWDGVYSVLGCRICPGNESLGIESASPNRPELRPIRLPALLRLRRRRVALKKNWLRLMHVARLNDAARRTYGLEAASKQCVGIYRISAASAASYVNVATRP